MNILLSALQGPMAGTGIPAYGTAWSPTFVPPARQSRVSVTAITSGVLFASRTLSTNNGSVDSFHVSIACSFSLNGRQIRDTALCDIPVAVAIEPSRRNCSRSRQRHNLLYQ
jgi:hypothetical protein